MISSRASLLITFGIVVVGGIIIDVLLVMPNGSEPLQPQNPVTLPSSSPSDVSPAKTTVIVKAIGGGTLTVNDFKGDPETIVDPSTPGYYYLAGGWIPGERGSPYSPFTIQYKESDQSFIVTLNKEPIGQTRTDAEKYLAQKLGASQAVMCRLHYAVFVTYDVNMEFSGRNLGFSFCPGAAVLP